MRINPDRQTEIINWAYEQVLSDLANGNPVPDDACLTDRVERQYEGVTHLEAESLIVSMRGFYGDQIEAAKACIVDITQ